MPDLEIVRNKPHIPMEVVVPRIVEIGLQRQPSEACGIIVANLSTPPREWVIELTNRSTQPTSSYEIDAATINQILSDLEVWGDVLVWHTHPSGFSGPSARDMSTRVEGIKYLVVALPHGEASIF